MAELEAHEVAGSWRPTGHPIRLIAIAAVALVAFIVGVTWAVAGPSSNPSTPVAGGPRMAQPGANAAPSSPPVGHGVDASAVPVSPLPTSPDAVHHSPSRAPVAPSGSARPVQSQAPRALTASLASTSWPGALSGLYTIHNVSTAPVNGWTVVVTFGGSPQRLEAWGASASPVAQQVTFTAMSYNAAVSPDGSVTFGFTVYGSGVLTPTGCTVNGRPC